MIIPRIKFVFHYTKENNNRHRYSSITTKITLHWQTYTDIILNNDILVLNEGTNN